ncbi:MAG: penicillin-binding protein 2 [Deltaproteobacteria bacterium]|nr:MAG: penicillin-binding protein 2 [Deltaproteobacteria bacterium]
MTLLLTRREVPATLRRRLVVAIVSVLLLFALTLGRLWHLQVTEGDQYRSLSENNRIRLKRVRATRGTILDRHGQILVDNRPSFDVALVPEDAHDVPRTLASLTRLLHADGNEFRSAMQAAANRPPFEEVILKRDLDWESIVALETHQLDLPGVSVQVGPRRTYPFNDTAAHLLGYVGEVSQQELANRQGYRLGDLIGKAGAERYWEDYLRGIDGGQQVEVDAVGRKLRTLSEVEETPGNTLVMTLDRDLQLAAERAMGDHEGAVVALDPRSGAVLAMVSRPAFDPNVFARGVRRAEWKALTSDRQRPLNSKAVQGTYPPGSTFKVVMAAAALEEGVVNPFTQIFCGGGIWFGNREFRCWRPQGHGNMNVHEALVRSCDVFFYQVGQRLGVDAIAEYAHRFGLGAPTGITLEHESGGIIPSSAWKRQRFGEPWYAGETLSVAIGQGYVTTTPLQMANVIAAIANNGTVYRPQFVKRVETPDGTLVREEEPVVERDLGFKKTTLLQIRQALSDVVNSNRGTGSKARVKGIEVGGKTGTSQVGKLGAERTKQGHMARERKDHAWFIAFAPVSSPEIAVAVLAEHAGEHGGTAAAPMAQQVIAHYFGVADDDDATIRQTARVPF